MPPRPPSNRPSPGFAMSLAPYELEALKAAHVFTNSKIMTVRQVSGRWILRGEESGGAGSDVGHYVGYAPLADWPFQVIQPIRTVMPNAQHRRVFGTVMVRFEIFRYAEKQMHAQISLHTVLPSSSPHSKEQNNHVRRVLFEERFGEMGEDNTPAFISSAGEPKPLPAFLLDAFRLAFNGSRCRACRHTHLEKVAPITLPPVFLQSLRLNAHKSAEGDK
jgi:hypothetical protein